MVFLVLVRFTLLHSQQDTVNAEIRPVQGQIPSTDTIITLRGISADAIDQQVTYQASGKKINDLVNRKVTLIGTGQVNYGDILIEADSIIFNMDNNQIYAVGIMDSTGQVTGKPYFKSGSDEFEADTLRYNFKTKKAIIKNIITQQEEGLLHSQVTKLLEDGTSNVYNSTYSTCDLDTPHFYIALKKAKVYPGEKIISGPGNLVLEGIPLPIYIPFGYFPIQTKRAASGILIPKPHYEANRGYALQDGGYYFAINDYFDLTLMGNIFTNGSWLVSAQTSYNKLYKYSGNFSFSYANNVSGHKGLEDYRKQTNYSLGWTYSQNAKARPGSRFNASVNMRSAGFDRENSYDLNQHITTQRQSSISYSRTWAGTPFNLSASMNHSQNVKNKTVSLNLPKVNFSTSRIYPLKGSRSATKKWWQELSFQYTASIDNRINTQDSLLFTNEVWSDMNNGFQHKAPLSLQLRPFSNFSISPSLTYEGVSYTRKYIRHWDSDLNTLITDTLTGIFYGHAINPSISAGYSPQIFGIFDFVNPDSRIDAIRHVIKPSVSFSFIPYFDGLSSKMYYDVQTDTTGNTRRYSIFDGNIFGTPSLSQKRGGISFSLINILEAKVFQRGDTTGKAQNVKLIDNFGISTSYNIFADSMPWSPVAMNLRTTLFEEIGISATANFSMYGLSPEGRQVATYYFSQSRKPLRLTRFGISLDFSLSDLLQGDKKKTSSSSQSRTNTQQPGAGGLPAASEYPPGFDEYGYAEFDVPWSMNVRYNYNVNYAQPGVPSGISHTVSVNGNVQLTKKMTIVYRSGYDFRQKKITTSQLQFSRDLHCWQMGFSWFPIGYMKMWTFTINVKAAVLSDLKYERRYDYHDNY